MTLFTATDPPHPVLGRERELAAIDAFLDAFLGAPGDAPRQLLITGDAGIGKSRLWEACLAGASDRGVRVLRARPSAAETDLSFAALADLVGSAFDRNAERLAPPQRRALAVALLRAEAVGPVDVRTIATAVLTLIDVLAGDGPLAIAIDDAQWLDEASARVLAFAARRLTTGVVLILGRRPDAVRSADLEAAIDPDRTTILRPGPLSVATLHHLIAAELGARPPRPALVRIAAASAGNPFYALELARSWRDTEPSATREELPVSIRLSEVVDRRIARLAPTTVETLRVVALLARPSRATVDRALERESAADIDAAIAGGLLAADGDRIQFTHPILGAVVAASIGDAERRVLHGRLADVVPDVEQAARHLSISRDEPDEAAAERVEDAAAMASRRGATAAAAELYAAAVRLSDQTGDGIRRRLVGEARARLAIGDVPGARSRAERALAVGEAGEVAEASLALADIAWADGRLAAARDGLAAALPKAPTEARGRIAARLVGMDVALAPARVAGIADIALGLLDAADEPALRGYVLINRFFAEVVAGGRQDRAGLEEGLRLESSDPTSAMSAIPLIWFNAIGDTDAARARHAAEDAWYRDRGQDGWRAERLAHLALTELWAGNWDRAEAHADASCAAIEAFDAATAWPTPFAWRSLVDAHRGRTERARATLLPLIEVADRGQNVQWAGLLWLVLGFVEFVDRRWDAADRALAAMRERFDSIGYREILGDRSEAYHVEALIELDEMERARAVLARLEERGRAVPRSWIAVALPRARALLLAASGDLESALAELATVDPTLADRLPFDAAWNALVEGRILRRMGRKRDAATTLAAALAAFGRLGAPAFERAARGELDRVGLRRADPLVLTASERRIAELAASGMTNREIALAAFVSPKTVEANLARVYGKLGIRSRAELGARMAGSERGESQT